MIEKRTAANGRVYYMKTGESGSGYASKAEYDAFVSGGRAPAKRGRGNKGKNKPARASSKPAPQVRETVRIEYRNPPRETAARDSAPRYDDLFDAITRR